MQGLGEGHLGAVVDGLLEGLYGLDVEGREAVGQGEGVLLQSFWGCEPGDEAVVEGRLGGDGPSS